MDPSQIGRLRPASVEEPPTIRLATPHDGGGGDPAPAYRQCDDCGAPVDDTQRYCVVCGAHRRNVDDPAARYFAQTTSRSRASRPAGGAQPARRSGGRSRGLGTALALAIIPVAAAAGVLVGRSSNNGDAKLIQALARHQAAVVTSSSAAASRAATTSPASPVTRSASARHGNARKVAARHSTSSTSAGKAVSTTQYGSVSQIAGSKPTKAQEQQGAQDTQQVQKATGKSYVNQQSNLPGTVVVP
jgi:hypothetical protein